VFVIPYLDDLIIYSRNEKEHKIHLNTVKERIRFVGLSLNKSKCKLFKKELKILVILSHMGK
jgi:hypothetical protein